MNGLAVPLSGEVQQHLGHVAVRCEPVRARTVMPLLETLQFGLKPQHLDKRWCARWRWNAAAKGNAPRSNTAGQRKAGGEPGNSAFTEADCNGAPLRRRRPRRRMHYLDFQEPPGDGAPIAYSASAVRMYIRDCSSAGVAKIGTPKSFTARISHSPFADSTTTLPCSLAT